MADPFKPATYEPPPPDALGRVEIVATSCAGKVLYQADLLQGGDTKLTMRLDTYRDGTTTVQRIVIEQRDEEMPF